MREIVLDTETTGLDAKTERIIEIGCVELHNYVPTGREFHRYINPQKEIDAGAVAVHGLTNDFLADKPPFADIVDAFLTFIGEAPLVAHNAGFDMGFINAELTRLGRAVLPDDRAIDTLVLARQRYPGAQASLDALCRRFEIDLSERNLHGALLDSQLLAAVYLELRGGRQQGLGLVGETGEQTSSAQTARPTGGGTMRPPRPHAPSAEELAAHAALVAQLKDPLWARLSK